MENQKLEQDGDTQTPTVVKPRNIPVSVEYSNQFIILIIGNGRYSLTPAVARDLALNLRQAANHIDKKKSV